MAGRGKGPARLDTCIPCRKPREDPLSRLPPPVLRSSTFDLTACPIVRPPPDDHPDGGRKNQEHDQTHREDHGCNPREHSVGPAIPDVSTMTQA